MRMRLVVPASIVLAGALLAGCRLAVDGTPTREALSPTKPTEPSFPTPRPSRTTIPAPGPSVARPPPTAAPPGGEQLPADNGYVYIETKSGKTRCQLTSDAVGCEADFVDSPAIGGVPANGVSVTRDGHVTWLVGNLGDIPVVTLDYRIYSAVGWNIDAREDGTRFTNARTGHGMVVAVAGVQTF